VEASRLVALAWISLRRLKHEGRCGRGGRGGGAYIEAAVLGTPGPHDDGKASGFLPAALPGSRGVGTLGWICQPLVRMRGMQDQGQTITDSESETECVTAPLCIIVSI